MSILNMSVNASILLILVLVIRMFARNKVPKQTFLILWGIVALKLLIPYAVYSRLTLQPLLPFTHSGSIQYTISPASNTLYHQLLLMTTNNFVQYLWISGVIGILLFFIIAYVRFYKEFQTAIPVKNNEYLDQWLSDHQLKRKIRIAISDRITTPLTYGIFKPVILFPKSTNWEDAESMRFILAHELFHIKRFDALWKFILTVILALHWFNPLVWLMYFLVNRDIELSCDEKVIRKFGDKAKSAYAHSLINMADETYSFTPHYNHFSKNGIEERIVSIMMLKKKSILGTVLACTLVIGGMTVFATTGQEPPTLKEGTGFEVEEETAKNSGLSNEVSSRLEIDSESVEGHASVIKSVEPIFEEPELIGDDDPRFEFIKE